MADDVTVTLPREMWQALLDHPDLKDETYTGPGINLFNAYQAIQRAVEAEGPKPGQDAER